mgnify:CR=1 FL=1
MAVGHAVFGQHHSDCLHQEPGWDSLASTLPALYRPATVVRCGKDHASCQPHSRMTERACGRPVSLSLPSNRMGAESRGFPGVAPSFSAHGDRPVCHEIQRKASPLCVTRPGSTGAIYGRPIVRVASPGPLCLSSVPTSDESSSEGPHGRMRHDPDHPLAVESVLDYAVAFPSSGNTDMPPTPTGPPASERPSTSAPRATGTVASRVQTELPILQKEEFTPAVLDRLTSDRRPGTLAVYGAKWRVFSAYCLQRQLDPLKLTVPQLAEFFQHLLWRKRFAQ